MVCSPSLQWLMFPCPYFLHCRSHFCAAHACFGLTEFTEFVTIQPLYSRSIFTLPSESRVSAWHLGTLNKFKALNNLMRLTFVCSGLTWGEISPLKKDLCSLCCKALPFICAAINMSKSLSQPLSLSSPAQHWEVLWDQSLRLLLLYQSHLQCPELYPQMQFSASYYQNVG